MRYSGLIAAALMLPALGACASSQAEREPVFAAPATATAPAALIDVNDIAGDYTLVAYGSQGLPFTVERDRVTNCTEEILEGRLDLEADGTWIYTYVERDVCEDEVELETETVAGTFEIHDGRIHFDEKRGEDGAEGDGTMEARNFDFGLFHGGLLLIEPEGLDGIYLAFQP